jgi:hypothetical protein
MHIIDARRANTSLCLFGKLVEPEGTAAEIDDMHICGDLRFEPVWDRVHALLTGFLYFQEACFTHDAQMFGDVVLRDVQMFGDTGDAHRFLEQETKDS